MTQSETNESPLQSAGGAVGPHATAAFGLLANETRLAILLALWEAYQPHEESNSVPFSELRNRVGVRDSGQFNYHLGKLQERFIRKTDAGYELKRVGLLLIQSIIAGTGIEEPSFEPTEIKAPCENCGAMTEISYDNVYVYQRCPECGKADHSSEHPPGLLKAWTFEPTGLSGRTAEEVFTASTIKNFARIALRFEDICPDCSGAVEWTLDVCEDHISSSDEVCPNCGREELAVVRETCTVCKSSGYGTPAIKVLFHPAVIAFFYNHGIEIGFTGDTDLIDIINTLNLVDQFDQKLASIDPIRLQISITADSDELQLILDEEMAVVDVEVVD